MGDIREDMPQQDETDVGDDTEGHRKKYLADADPEAEDDTEGHRKRY